LKPTSQRWKQIGECRFPWEKEALEYVRERLPDIEPYRAWANVEFLGLDQSINEVDLLVLGPAGLFVVEIKSMPGCLAGDAGTWTWRFEKRDHIVDNPVYLTNLKAKRLKSLLQRGKAVAPKDVPYVEPAVFCSAAGLAVQLPEEARARVFGRDAEDGKPAPALPGIVAELTRNPALDAVGSRRRVVDTALARALTRAVDEAGIRPKQSARRVGDYNLERLVFEGNLFQDWSAVHRSRPNTRRRIRIYAVPAGTAASVSKETVLRAANREFELLQSADHPGILRAHEYVEHELGPALLFEPAENAVRLDHYLREKAASLTVDLRLHLLRTVAETLRFAHGKGLYHRALSPQSLLVLDPKAELPKVKIFNWQTGVREAASTTSRGVTGTEHLDLLIDDASAVYMAPEALTSREAEGVDLDVFSLGALAYHLFTGRPPAANLFDLSQLLQQGEGLVLSGEADGVSPALQKLVKEATAPEATRRLSSVVEFLAGLEKFEDDLTRPFEDVVSDPDAATAGSRLPGGFTVKRRLGTGSTATAFLVEREGRELVLKLAVSPEHHARLEDEAEVLKKLSYPGIVPWFETVEMYGRAGLLLGFAGEKTLAERLEEEGSLSLDQLRRWGDDLLKAVGYLEEKGIPHRDIKPENLGIARRGPDDALHLVLFDFSLSRAPLEAIQAGTKPYLEPFLGQRRPRRWDLAAERWAVAMTLYRMATGGHPRWGDGASDPAVLKCEATIDAETIDAAVREPLAAFFERAFRRDPKARFDNADQMRAAWLRAFEAAERPTTQPPAPAETAPAPPAADPEAAWQGAALDTSLAELPLSARAVNSLDRAGIVSVRDLLSRGLGTLRRIRGAGSLTRREVVDAFQRLRSRFPGVVAGAEGALSKAATAKGGGEGEPEAELPLVSSVDELFAQVSRRRFNKGATTEKKLFGLYLGLDTLPGAASARQATIPTQKELARQLKVSQPQVSITAGKFRLAWSKNPSLTKLRREIAEEILPGLGGVATLPELLAAVLASRGSTAPEPDRQRHLRAVVLAALETERGLKEPSFEQHRAGETLLLALDERLADWAEKLGRKADQLAAADPLPSPARVLELLQSVPLPADLEMPTPVRLVRLAAAVSATAAASSRLEIYPKGLSAARAVKLAAGAVVGTGEFTLDDLRARVHSRYPEAEPLPDRPLVDDLLSAAGLDLRWASTAREGSGAFVPGTPSFDGLTSRTRIPAAGQTVAPFVPAHEDAAGEFDERLARASRDGGFLVLLAPDREMQSAERALASRFALPVRSVERMLLDAMKRVAAERRIRWDVVLRADSAPPESEDGRRLRELVRLALPAVEATVAAVPADGRPVLLTNPGLLVRYGQMALLDRLRDRASRPDGGLAGVWLLLPADEQTDRPVLDGAAVPVLTPNQWARIPDAWLRRRAAA